MISTSDRRKTVELIEEAHTSGARREKACEEAGITLRTYQRWTGTGDRVKTDGRPLADRPDPANKLTLEEREQIVAVCNQEEFQSLSPAQIVPALADKNIYIASEASFYRVLKANDQLAHRGKTQEPRKVDKPKGYTADGPNQVWSWDITYLASTVTGVFFRLYLVMDIFSRKIVGWEIHENETSAHASVLIQKACLSEGVRREQLVLHSDNGSPMKGATMLATLQKLGVVPSFSRPSVSDDNPFSESLFRTLKYTPAYPSKPFESLDSARAWVYEFVKWYNNQHHHSAIRFVTPQERHSGQEQKVLYHRQTVYGAAKERHPERWSGNIRNWTPIKEVFLNPDKTKLSEDKNLKRAA